MKNLPAIKQLLGKADFSQTLLIETVLRICADECKSMRYEKQLLEWENQRLQNACSFFTEKVLWFCREYQGHGISRQWFEKAMAQWIEANPKPQPE